MTNPEPVSNVVRPHFRPAAEELIAKLINGGYLQPALRNDPAAITVAIGHLKEDLRGSGGSQAEAKKSLTRVSRRVNVDAR
jgi:hypothetical protein